MQNSQQQVVKRNSAHVLADDNLLPTRIGSCKNSKERGATGCSYLSLSVWLWHTIHDVCRAAVSQIITFQQKNHHFSLKNLLRFNTKFTCTLPAPGGRRAVGCNPSTWQTLLGRSCCCKIIILNTKSLVFDTQFLFYKIHHFYSPRVHQRRGAYHQQSVRRTPFAIKSCWIQVVVRIAACRSACIAR